MGNFPINIPDAQEAVVIDGWCKEFSYMPTINNLPNPETKRQFFRRMLIAEIKRVAAKHYVPPDVGIT